MLQLVRHRRAKIPVTVMASDLIKCEYDFIGSGIYTIRFKEINGSLVVGWMPGVHLTRFIFTFMAEIKVRHH